MQVLVAFAIFLFKLNREKCLSVRVIFLKSAAANPIFRCRALGHGGSQNCRDVLINGGAETQNRGENAKTETHQVKTLPEYISKAGTKNRYQGGHNMRLGREGAQVQLSVTS